MIELTVGDVIAIVVGLIALIIGIVAFMRKNPQATPVALDTEAARLVGERQLDRAYVERLERAYQSNSVAQQRAFDTLAAIMRFVAPLTPLKTDDAISKLLEDIQKPGPEEMPAGEPPSS